MNINHRPLKKEDRTTLAHLANNKKIWDKLMDRIPFPYGIEDADFFIDLKGKDDPLSTFAIVDETDEFLGVISLELKNDIYRFNAELGYWIGEPHWGKGIATKAIALITKFGFDTLDLNRIYACVFEGNDASMHVLVKNGYEKEAVLKNSVHKNGIYLDEHVFVNFKKG